jgi:hypothetical protein
MNPVAPSPDRLLKDVWMTIVCVHYLRQNYYNLL